MKVNGELNIQLEDDSIVGVGSTVRIIAERDKTEMQDTVTDITGVIVSFSHAPRDIRTEYKGPKYKAVWVTAVTTVEEVQDSVVDFITIRKANGDHVSFRGFRIQKIFKVV